jgi:hypothetical protein
MKKLGIALALVLGAFGCDDKKAAPPAAAAPSTAGGGGGGAIKASCNSIKTLSTCTDYTEAGFALGEGFVKGACEATNSKYAATPCPAAKQVGTCTIQGGQLRRYYAEGSLEYKAADAAKDCKDLYSGTWAAK